MQDTSGSDNPINLPVDTFSPRKPEGLMRAHGRALEPGNLSEAVGYPDGGSADRAGPLRGPARTVDLYEVVTRTNKQTSSKSLAYFNAKVGCLYHQERLAHLTVGFRRGEKMTYRKARRVIQQLMQWFNRETGEKPEYRITWVREPDRIHAHILIDIPFVQQKEILKQVQIYAQDQCSVFIEFLSDDEDRARTIKYVMQYGLKQKGIVSYAQSRKWLPVGSRDFWMDLKKEMKAGGQGGIMGVREWREAAIKIMDEWVLYQRERVKRRKS